MSATHESTLVFTVAMVSFGEEPLWDSATTGGPEESSPEELFGKAIGVDRAQSDGLGDLPPWLPSTLELRREVLRLIAKGELTAKGRLKAVEGASIEQLRQAFVDARMLLRLGTVTAAIERLHGAGAFGFRIISRLAKTATTYQDRARLVAACIVFRNIVSAENFDAVASTVEEHHDVAQQILDVKVDDETIRRMVKKQNLPTLTQDD